MKLFFFISFLTTILFSQKIDFKEIKYIYALDTHFDKRGTLDLENSQVTLHYKNSEKSIIYTDDNIQIITNNTIETFTHEESVEYNLFFQLVLGIYTNNTIPLSENFTIKKDDKTVTLLPKEYLSSVIKTIEYEKDNDKLKYLKINFTNQDRITIEEME